jgi:hypothetical protein
MMSRAQDAPESAHRIMPYGYSCPKGGGPYGMRRPVRTADDARCMVERAFLAMGQKVQTSKIEKKEYHYEVQVLNRDGTVADCIIVDNRTGRMRSTY